MKKLDIEQSIRNVIAHDTPDLFDKITAAPVKKMESEDYIVKARPREHHSGRFRSFTAVCTSMVLLFAICLGFMQGYPVYAIDSVMYIDINPGFKIVTNISGKVTGLKGTNQDGEQVVSNISYKNKQYEEVLVESLQEAKQQGYITTEKENVILVSVKSQSDKRCDSIKVTAVADIEDNLSNDNMTVVVYSQKLEETSELEALANEYKISTGKAQFIMKLVSQDPSLTVASLADLSLQELEALSVEKNIDLTGLVDCNKDTDVASNNNTSSPDTGYITTEDIVVPKQDDPTDTGTTADDTTTAPPNTDSTSSSTSSTSTEDSEVGTAVPKTACDVCDSHCSCPNCSTGCKPRCPNCDSSCPNSKNPGKEPENTTGPTTTEEDEEIFESKNTEDLLIIDPEDLDPGKTADETLAFE